MRWRVAGTTSWTNTASFSVGKVTNAPWYRDVSGLTAGTQYEYQVCGKESSQSTFVCAGPAGTTSTEPFATTGGSDASARYLSPAGSDANDGRSPATPWRTFQHAVQTAPNPSTVYLLSGTYPSFGWSDYRARSGFVTFVPYPGTSPTVRGFSTPGTGTLRVNYVAFERLKFTGPADIRGSHLRFEGNSHAAPGLHAIRIQDGSDDVHIEDNRIGGGSGTAVFLSSGPGEPVIKDVYIRRNDIDGLRYVGMNIRNFSNVIVEDNEISNLDRPAGDSLHTDVVRTFGGGTGLVVRRNFMHDNEAIQFFIKDGKVSNVTFENNLIVRTAGAFNGVKLYDVEGLRMINNTVEDDIVFGEGTATKIVFFNNIMNSFGAVPGGSQQYDYRGYNLIGGGSAPLVVTEIFGRATYLNAAANDYRLASGSLGVDDGTPGGGGYSVPPLDRLGRPRPAAGTQVDIGAHERQPNDP